MRRGVRPGVQRALPFGTIIPPANGVSIVLYHDAEGKARSFLLAMLHGASELRALINVYDIR